MSCRVLASVALLALIAGACGNDDVTAPADSLLSVDPEQPSVTDGVATTTPHTAPADDTIQGNWTLVRLTIGDEPFDVLGDWTVTLTIEGDQISGRAACNSYGGTVQADGTGGGRFVTSELFSTEMGCEQVAMEMEQQFLGALQAIDSYELAGRLYLANVGVGTSIEFRRNVPVPEADLTGTTWVLDTLISGDAASNMAGMENANLEFGDDGTITGTTGCRRLEGAWASTGDAVRVDSLAAIDDPAAGMCASGSDALDSQFVSVVEKGVTAEIEGQRLTLLAPSGDGLSFRVGSQSNALGAGSVDTDDAGVAELDTAGGVDGPVMYSRQTDRSESEAAEIRGMLVLEGDCLYLTAEFGRFPVLWPFGTHWQTEPAAVVLPDGSVMEIGENFAGGGGYHDAESLQGFTGSEAVAELAARCAERDFREVAVVQGR